MPRHYLVWTGAAAILAGGWLMAAQGPSSEPKSSAEVAAPTDELGRILQKQSFVAVTISRLRVGYQTVTVRLAGVRLNLMLDTGAVTTHFDRARTKHLLKWRDREGEPATIDGRKVSSATCWVEQLEIGTLRTGRFEAGEDSSSELNTLLKKYGDPPIDGILGLDILERHAAVIDCSARRLYLRKQRGEE
jgi:predicted aspartyl protease